MKDIKLMMEKSTKVFDTIDFVPYLRQCKTLGEFRDALEKDYDNTPTTNNDFMEGYFFNVFNGYEIIDYLKERYGNKVSIYEGSYFTIDWED